MTKAEFKEICELVCPHCMADATATPPRLDALSQRKDTLEFVHNYANQHSICWASGFRNSRFAKELTDVFYKG